MTNPSSYPPGPRALAMSELIRDVSDIINTMMVDGYPVGITLRGSFVAVIRSFNNETVYVKSGPRFFEVHDLVHGIADVMTSMLVDDKPVGITLNGRIVAVITPTNDHEVISSALRHGPLADELRARMAEDDGTSYTTDEVERMLGLKAGSTD